MGSFDPVADEYDAARPTYPDGVFDALGPLDGFQVLDVGAGTGIATRALIARQANVIAVDPGPEVLRRASARTPGLAAVVADGAVLPVRSGVVDILCFAQAWHWLDESSRVAEAHRVLRPGGRWAGWWSPARADGERWFDVGDRVTVPWVRETSVEDWMTDQASHSYVAGLPEGPRAELLGELRAVLDEQFPTEAMSVRYETWLWIATRI